MVYCLNYTGDSGAHSRDFMLILRRMNKASNCKPLAGLMARPVRLLEDESAMQALGKELAETLPAGSLVTLSGELGAGKSVLVRAIIHTLGYTGRVKSPTYTLIESYEVPLEGGKLTRIAHLDLYRLEDPAELDYLGFDDVLAGHELVLIEWPEKGGDRVPKADLQISIRYAADDRRELTFSL